MSGVTGGDGKPDPYRAFRRGHLAVDNYMSKALQAEGKLAEVAATGHLLTEAFPDVRYYPFTQHQEKSVGADWLWWWIDAGRNTAPLGHRSGRRDRCHPRSGTDRSGHRRARRAEQRHDQPPAGARSSEG